MNLQCLLQAQKRRLQMTSAITHFSLELLFDTSHFLTLALFLRGVLEYPVDHL